MLQSFRQWPRAGTRRPRLLVALALVGFLYGVIGLITAWSTVVALTGSHDRFTSAVRTDPARMLGLPQTLGTPAEQARVADRKADALWARRGVLLPLAGINAITALLVLLGLSRTMARGGKNARWGRSAWQLGALVGLPCLAMETLVAWLHSRDLIAAISALHDPLADMLRELLPMRDHIVLGQALVVGVYLAGTAWYLTTQAVARYCADVDA